MAVYKLNSEKAQNRGSRARKITGFTMIGVSSLVFLFMTGIVPAIQRFFLGVFGLFGYVLCILMIVIGLAVLNKRKYVMPKRYAICLILAVICFLAIIQLIIVGGKNGQNFGQYWKLNYTKTWTAGGFLLGFLTTCTMYITNAVGSYLIFGLGLAVNIALLVDCLRKMKEEKEGEAPVSLQVREVEEKQPDSSAADLKKFDIKEKEKEQEETNVVLDGNRKEEESPRSAKQMLGLDHKRNYAYEYHNRQVPSGAEAVAAASANAVMSAATAKPVKPNTVPTNSEELKKYIKDTVLTPPEVDIDEYFKNIRTRNAAPSKEVVEENVRALKEETPVSQSVNEQPRDENVYAATSTPVVEQEELRNDEFVEENNQFDRSLEEVDSQELVDQADGILRDVVEEEKNNFQEYDEPESIEENNNFERRDFGRSENVDAERNVLDRLPERDNSGAFERRSFDRNDRVLSQEDLDARNDFNRDIERISMRNGTLARESGPIPQEEEKEPYVPYEYTKPPIDLITTKSVDLSTLNADVSEKRVALEQALATFGIAAVVQNVVIGPAVTRYELEMPQGISVSKIKNLADDIAYALAANGAIRIEAPVPGRSVVGIEVPNSTIATISLRDILESREFMEAKSPLTVAIGKDISGRVICGNLQKYPHLLVAGTTGSGKSVCLNSIILSLIYKSSPEDVKIVLIDPKRVEFASYEGLPHLIMPKLVCDTSKAINAFAWAVEEMEKRYKMLELARVKNIDEFNQTPDVVNKKIRKMPFIVIIVDEMNELMITGKKEVEEKIMRLAQKSRAAGIHMILATQRPSVDVITGVIKANLPSKISFAVSKVTDSTVVIDRPGAEKLLGRGDMLYFPLGANDPVRVQGCFVSTPEINNIIDFVRDNNELIFDTEIENRINNPNANINGQEAENRSDEIDPLFKQALKACIDAGFASGTMLRRKFCVGFARAGRLLDQMTEAGHISPPDGAKPRKIYITEEEFNDLYGNDE